MKLMNKNWKYLIVLDACRHDYFKKVYSNYLKGKLKKIKSTGRFTVEWAKTQFTDYYDLIYISTNPFINSMISVKQGGIKFEAKKHFSEIVDMWRYDVDPIKKVVLPKTVNERVLEKIKKAPKKRMIIHYMQPHYPYIHSNYSKFDKYTKMKIEKKTDSGFIMSKPYLNPFSEKIKKMIPPKILIKLSKILGKTSPKIKILEEIGEEKLRDAYQKNLEIVLEEVAKLCSNLNGKIVITSDHGEFLGEDGIIGHNFPIESPILREVPYFELREVKDKYKKKIIRKDRETTSETKKITNKKEIKKRLRTLGYF